MTYYSQPGASFTGSQWSQNSVQPSAFKDLLYAFPKPRLSGRIAKPRSAGNSPSAGRRRTATMHSSPMYCQPPNQDYQTSLNAALLLSAIQNRRRSRPISWHPASRQPEYSAPSQCYPSNMTTSYNLPVTQACLQPSQTMGAGGLDENMLQFPATDIATMQQRLALSSAESKLPIPEPSFLQPDNQLDGALWDGSQSGLPYVTPMSNDWPFDMVSVNQSIPSVGVPASNYGSVSSPSRLTEPATPDFLPIQQFGDDADPQSMSPLEKPDAGELVGMGLYNNPETFADGSLCGMNGKGLKLEETFSPSEENEADNDADNSHQGSNQTSPGQTQQSTSHRNSSNKQPNKPAESMMQKSFFFEDDDLEQRATVDFRPSFNNNFAATSCMNYGYGWI
ncbi:hypothetical protein BDW62DRAFT_6714 [Aspergillus aurantiobrunneus]